MSHDESVADVEGGGEITITLTASEALVLFDWLNRTWESDTVKHLEDKSEQLALWKLEGKLESVLVSPFTSDYGKLLSLAKEELRAYEE